jgi:hypothetical protein
LAPPVRGRFLLNIRPNGDREGRLAFVRVGGTTIWSDRKMQTYRVYFLGPDDHIKAVEVISCKNDAEAKLRAAGFLKERKAFASVEVWREKDMVHHVRREP